MTNRPRVCRVDEMVPPQHPYQMQTPVFEKVSTISYIRSIDSTIGQMHEKASLCTGGSDKKSLQTLIR